MQSYFKMREILKDLRNSLRLKQLDLMKIILNLRIFIVLLVIEIS